MWPLTWSRILVLLDNGTGLTPTLNNGPGGVDQHGQKEGSAFPATDGTVQREEPKGDGGGDRAKRGTDDLPPGALQYPSALLDGLGR